jgi:oligopeptide/dipeptide ABC transporter ATP-binding protein
MTDPTALLDIRDLMVHYGRSGRSYRTPNAVDGVSLTVGAGETVALVGESGSGKSSIGNAVVGLAPVAAGSIRFAGTDLPHATRRQRRALTAEIQAVFQDPYGSLNPVRTIRQTLVEPLIAHGGRRLAAARAGGGDAGRVAAILRTVGLAPEVADRYPVEFSGGQRQRVAIARALMLSPRLIVCDEPTSALDLSVQAQIINLLRRLQREQGLSYLFITHDLALIRHIAHRVVVLYRGRVMETGPTTEVCDDPHHPYTRALLAAAPVPDPAVQRGRRGSATTVATGPDRGCPFATRCPHVAAVCRAAVPQPVPAGAGRLVACVRYPDLPPAPDLPAAPAPRQGG